MLSGQRAWAGREVDTKQYKHLSECEVCSGQLPVVYISTNLLTRQINVFSINLIMTDSSASEYLGTPVIADLRSLPRVQSITEQSN